MYTATPPWDAVEEVDDFTPPCPDDVIPDRERERLDEELNERWWKYWRYED